MDITGPSTDNRNPAERRLGPRRRQRGALAVGELVERARRGDQEALGELVQRFRRMVEGRLRSLGLHPTLVDDAAQSTWIRLASSLDQLRDPSSLGGWLRVTAYNEAMTTLRRERRVIPVEGFDEYKAPEVDPSEHLIAAARCEAVRSALDRLNERQRSIIELRYLRAEAASYEEIACSLDIGRGSVGPTIGRAIQRMSHHPEVVELR